MSVELNIYFIHAAFLQDRARIINDFTKQINKYSFKNISKVNVQTITEYDPNSITGEIIQKTVNYTHIKQEDELKDDNKTSSLTFYNQFIKNMHLFQLSSALKHYKAIQNIAQNSKPDDINIILEDDVIYEEKMCSLLEKVFKTLPPDFDILFLGLPTNKEIKNRNEITYQNTSEIYKILPFNDSYIVSTEIAKKIATAFLPIKFTTNIQLSYLIELLNLKTVITVPNMFMGGSSYGVFLSTLNPNNLLLFNNDFMAARNTILREAPLTNEEIIKLEELFAKSTIQQHPDFQYVKAQFLTKLKKYKEAETIYENALNIYISNNCVVNHESLFLKDYIRLHKNLQ